MINVTKWSQNRNYKWRENVYIIVYGIYFTDKYLAAREHIEEGWGKRENLILHVNDKWFTKCFS